MTTRPDYYELMMKVNELEEEIVRSRRVELALKKSEEFSSSLLENSPDAIIVYNTDTSVKYVNPSFEKITGYSSVEALGIKVPYPWWTDDLEYGTLEERVKLGLKGIYQTERRYRKKNGDYFYVELNVTPIFHKGKLNYSFSTWTDINDRKKMENALKKARDELEGHVKERTRELKEANKKLYEKTLDLEEVNTALKVLLERRDKDKEENEEKILLNVKELLLPYITRLKKSPLTDRQKSYVDLLESGLQNIISPFAHRLSSRYMNITPGEMQVLNLVKEGKTSKEIAEILHSTERAVIAHRLNFRKKLGLDRKTNLRTYLLSFK